MRFKGIVRIANFFALCIIVSLLLSFSKSFAQFYNGSQLTFGKNRVQYIERFFSYIRFSRYDIYYYKEGKPLALYTARYVEKNLAEIERRLDFTLDNKIQFVVFNKYSDLKQSNIGLLNEDQYNTGGVTHIVGTKVFLYFNGDHKNFEEQIRYGICDIIFNEVLYGQSYFSMIKNSTLIAFPDWYLLGLISYMSKDWDAEIENNVKDGILSGRYKRFSDIESKEAVYAGHSVWKYIAEKYGESTISNILYISKVNKGIENGFLFVLGISYKTLMKEWYESLLQKYSQISNQTYTVPDNYIQKRLKSKYVYSQLKVSRDGTKAAYVTNELGQYKIFIQDINKKRKKRIMKREHRLDEKVDYSYPLLAWHPDGRILSIILESKGKTWLYFYSTETKLFEKRPIYLFEKILDFSYSDRGDKFVLSAIQNGYSDIFVYNIVSNTFENITKDKFDDFNPCFINNSKDIIFASTRKGDTIKSSNLDDLDLPENVSTNKDLFIYHYSKRSPILRRVTNTALINETFPKEYDNSYITYLSDENGIINRYIGKLDSAVSLVDTTIHYRYFTNSFPVTNNLFNIIEQDFYSKSQKFGEILFSKNKYKLFINDKVKVKDIKQIELFNYIPERTEKKAEKTNSIEKNDSNNSIQNVKHKRFKSVFLNDNPLQDSSRIDINNYSFGKQMRIDTNSTIYKSKIKNISTYSIKDNAKFKIPRAQNANTEYSIDQLVNQVDFSYLNTTYQQFTGGGGPIFINPGFNAFFKLGITDLFEDYRIVGGIRLSTNLSNNEYFISFNNLKHRLDKEIILHRLSVQYIEPESQYTVKQHSNELLYMLKYPFNSVANVKLTSFVRNDIAVHLSEDQKSLKMLNTDIFWAGLKAEYNFDNTRNKGLNLFYGTRYKFFAEYFKQINNKSIDLAVFGFDYRKYIKIHRTFIWANRFATSTSIGKNKLIYYMGGVDTWLKPDFDKKTNISNTEHYVYQTLATNMRGFKQNIRNGNSFAVFNSELRLPVFRYFIKRPIKSDFISNFQIVAFSDVGTAWNGSDPFSDKNALYTQVFEKAPIKVTVQNQNDPIVFGFGGGLRSRIFGYFVRADYAWGVQNSEIQKPIFYLSISLDF